AINKDSKKHGTTGEEVDLALLVDGLQSEREQGITIDVAYRFFSTDKRKYIIADTPGHEQYTRNMATGASTADLAIILIDARHGVQTQTRRHSFITKLLGLKHIVVAINKMDLVDYSQQRYDDIKADYTEFAKQLGIDSPVFIPLSALKGDNVVNPSEQMDWYQGKPLMGLLDSIPIADTVNLEHFRFPVQYVNRPHLNFRGYSGTIAAGEIAVGDAVTVLPAYKTSAIKQVILPAVNDNTISHSAFAPSAVTLTLEDEIDISRGDMIVKSQDIPQIASDFKVMLVWMNEVSMTPGSDYLIKRATSVISGRFTQIDHLIDVNTLVQSDASKLELNQIAQCQLHLNQAIAYDAYTDIKGTGAFIVIDKYSNATLAAGMIVEAAETNNAQAPSRHYNEAEKALNAYIREHYPEWGCAAIDEVG
ncbi:MAG: GTP-binding protein, partial [Thiomicrospira sp.]